MRFSAATLSKATNTIDEQELVVDLNSFLFHPHNSCEAN